MGIAEEIARADGEKEETHTMGGQVKRKKEGKWRLERRQTQQRGTAF